MTAIAARPVLPTITSALVVTAVIAGVAADVTWEVWARAITPLWIGGPLEPAALVQSVFGLQSRFLAEIIHLVVGVLFYPLGYLLVAQPIARAILPACPGIWWRWATGSGCGCSRSTSWPT